MRYVLAVLLFSLSLSAQTTTPKKVATTKSKALLACEAKTDMAFSVSNDLATRNVELEAKNVTLQKQYTDALAVLRALDAETAGRVMTDDETKAMNTITPGESLNLGMSLEKRAHDVRENMITLAKHDGQAVDQYNALLTDYKDYVSRVGYQMAQMNSSYSNEQRINRSMALYNLMPKYSPPQTVNVNVSNCTVSPALCVNH